MLDLDTVAAFLNTLDERTYGGFVHKRPAERDEFATPAALARWLEREGVVSRPTRTTAADHRFVSCVRESLRAELRSGETAALNALAGELPLVARFEGGGAMPRLTDRVGPARRFVADVLFTALAATATGEWVLLKMCAAGDCRWVFHDRSRNHLGRWCNMEVCGNRVKTRNYRARRGLR